uniref:Uncharacterized protein n=1 Tax=Aegilops tauschii subsp. strangulata TaxID=200361 RepID=A0A452ZQ23_AEGTS
GIRGVTLSYDHRCVVSIAVEYDRSGLAVPGERHGGAGGNHTTQVGTWYVRRCARSARSRSQPCFFLTGLLRAYA